MDAYKKLASFYDESIAQSVPKTVGIISEFLPANGKLLDIGCGTGRLSEHFLKQGYEVTVIDKSEAMIEIARKHLKRANVFCVDLLDFESTDKFDVIVCLYDTINHLLDFESWKIFFSKYNRYLMPGGVLIFDINTVEKLNSLVGREIKKKNVLIKVSKFKKLFRWNITTPEGVSIIDEQSFPVPKIIEELNRFFPQVKTVEVSGRVYFVCNASGH